MVWGVSRALDLGLEYDVEPDDIMDRIADPVHGDMGLAGLFYLLIDL